MKDAEDVSRKVLIERWENCLRVLQGLTPHERRKHWSMSTWGLKNDCGTVACAAGHCAMDPWFRKRGLKMDFHLVKQEEFYGGDFWTQTFDDSLVKKFFGASGTTAIFHNTDRRSVGKVIKEVKSYLKYIRACPDEELHWYWPTA